MLRIMCKAKIHRAKVTKVELHYDGSIGIDKDLLDASGILPNEIVQVVNINNGARFETYVIKEPSGSGTIGLYGAAAHLAKVGDLVIILSNALMDDRNARKLKLNAVRVDQKNRIMK